jgi:hypothetical protein
MIYIYIYIINLKQKNLKFLKSFVGFTSKHSRKSLVKLILKSQQHNSYTYTFLTLQLRNTAKFILNGIYIKPHKLLVEFDLLLTIIDQ